MTQRTNQLLTELLQLPELEREQLIEQLLDQLDPPPSLADRMSDETFAAELERRHREAELDPSVLIPWKQVREIR